MRLIIVLTLVFDRFSTSSCCESGGGKAPKLFNFANFEFEKSGRFYSNKIGGRTSVCGSNEHCRKLDQGRISQNTHSYLYNYTDFISEIYISTPVHFYICTFRHYNIFF